jgi:hypothetical protein
MSVFDKVRPLVIAIKLGDQGNVIQVKLESVAKYRKRAAELQRDA